MPPVLKPDLDLYGTYARASCLADYLELLAFKGLGPKRFDLADLIVDRQWTRKMAGEAFVGDPLEQLTSDEEDDELSADADELEPEGVPEANRVFDVLAKRSDVLGDDYPFDVTDDDLTLRSGIDHEGFAYTALLAVTIAHAYDLAVTYEPEQVLEDTVVQALRELGLEAANVGEISRQPSTDFRQTVEQAGTAVGLAPTPLAAVSLKNANEEGVDALAHLSWGDSGPGAWVFIGQVTCGRSDGWKGKANQPSPGSWMDYLSHGMEPQPFLAVPHHIQPEQLLKLVQDTRRMILDRLRLTRMGNAISAREATLITEVLAADLEPVKAV